MIQFSPLIIGTMRLGNWGADLSAPALEQFIENCIENELTDFDLADIYGDYTTEAQIGTILKKRKDLSQKIKITTKCGINLISKNRPDNNIKYYDSGKHHIINSVNNSLKNTGVERIELLLLHRPDLLMDPAEIAETFEQLKKAGKVNYFGVSNFSITQFELLNSFTPLVNNQIEISLFKPDAMLNGCVDYLMKKNITTTAWSPLGGGDVFNNNTNAKLNDKLINIAEKYNAGIDQILFAWLVRHPAKIIPVTGTSKFERILSALRSLSIDLSKEDWYTLLQFSTGKEVA